MLNPLTTSFVKFAAIFNIWSATSLEPTVPTRMTFVALRLHVNIAMRERLIQTVAQRRDVDIRVDIQAPVPSTLIPQHQAAATSFLRRDNQALPER